MTTPAYPHDGQLYPSADRKYPEIIFFVHFFDGSRRSVLRHIQVVNKLGYDAFAFTLSKPTKKHFLPLSPQGQFGWKHYYAEQIEELLNLVRGPKIIFSFSNPSASAIEAMARRNCQDIRALICDSGPSARLGFSAIKLVGKYLRDQKYQKAFFTCSLSWTWSPFYHKDIGQHLQTFPKNFPILSIRGWKDELISPDDIDQVFEPHKNLNWIKLSLPEAHHLDGLKLFPQDYSAGLKSFLNGLKQ